MRSLVLALAIVCSAFSSPAQALYGNYASQESFYTGITLKFDPTSVRFWNILQKTAKFISLRNVFSKNISAVYGDKRIYHNVEWKFWRLWNVVFNFKFNSRSNFVILAGRNVYFELRFISGPMAFYQFFSAYKVRYARIEGNSVRRRQTCILYSNFYDGRFFACVTNFNRSYSRIAANLSFSNSLRFSYGAFRCLGVSVRDLQRFVLGNCRVSRLSSRSFFKQQIQSVAAPSFSQGPVSLEYREDQARDAKCAEDRTSNRPIRRASGFMRCFLSSESGAPLGAQIGSVVILSFIAGIGIMFGIWGKDRRGRRLGVLGAVCILGVLFYWLSAA